MDLFKKCQDYTRVDVLKEKDIYPYYIPLTSGQDTEVKMQGHRTIMIGSNNYLGLTSDKRVVEAGIEALKKYGSGCSGSRFLNGTLDIHMELEEEISKFLGKEETVIFSTGFQSNLGIIAGICGRNDVIVCDKENHASIYDACKLSYAKMVRYNHNDMQDLERVLSGIEKDKGILIVTDGVFSMSGEICNLPKIVELGKKYGARIMVDDAHAFGVIGKGGRGTASYYGLENEVDIIMGTFSKSLASLGGFMATSKSVANYIKHNSRPYIFSASIAPPNVACARAALEIIKTEPQRIARLQEIGEYVRAGLKKRGIKFIESKTPIVSIYIYDDEKAFIACRKLLNKGVYVNSVVSPAVPVGYALLRTSYTATHTNEQLDEAMDKIKEVLDELL